MARQTRAVAKGKGLRKFSKEYFAKWEQERQRGYQDGYTLKVWDAPKRHNMFYDAYREGYEAGCLDSERRD